MTDNTATYVIAKAHTISIDGLELDVIDGPDRGTCEPIRYGMTRVGTAPGSHVRLTDSAVSRMHCEVRMRHDDVRIIDRGSTNGTFVDGHRVFEAAVAPGMTIQLGTTSMRVQRGQDPLIVEVSEASGMGDLVGASVEMRRIYTIIGRVAPTEATVLLSGETGTGKDLIARAIHGASRRADGPFVAVDCGAIAESLVEAELFGHMRGAFTGAIADRVGLIEVANGGTLFLDEIGDLPLALQPKLLRAIESREVRPVGSNVARVFNARVIAATNQRLERSVNEGRFREDLYYRLAVVEIAIPPLRARREDIPLLASHFYQQFCPGEAPPESFLDAVLGRSWPGNVRELRNFVERSVSLGWGPTRGASATAVSSADLEPFVRSDLPLREARAIWESQLERAYVRALLKRTAGNVSRAADLAGVNRRTLHRILGAASVSVGATPRNR